jgi:hypothetical protein
VKQALLGQRYAYQKTFDGPHAQAVLKDLARFCRAHESTFDADPRVHAGLEGRREVWLRIEEYLKLSPEQLWELRSGRPANED